MRLHYLKIIICLIAPAIGSSGQPSYVDSMRQVFTREKDPAKKMDAFYEIASERSLNNPAMGFAYADSLAQMSKKFDSQKAMAMSKHLEGFAYSDQGNYEKSITLFQEELAIFQELNDTKEQSTVYTNLGSIWDSMGQSDSSVTYYLKALTLDEKQGDSLGASIVYNNIGQIYSDDGAYDKAIEYFEKALKIRQSMGLEKRYTQCYSNLATVYGRMGDFEKAEDYCRKALELADKYDNKSLAGIITNTMGNDLNAMQHYQEAIPWLERSRNYFKAIGNEAYETYPLYNLTISYAGIGDGEKALQSAREGYRIVEKLELSHQLELYYKAFALAYEAKKDYRQSLVWYRKYTTTIDSLVKVENAQQVASMTEKYESQKKEAKITQQTLELERQANLKNRILIGAIAVVLALAGLFQYFRSKQKIRQKEAELAVEKAALTAQLEHAEAEKLREMDALKSTFFANISHEFRTPLTLIISPLEQMLNGTFRGDFQKYYRIIHRNGKRLLDLVNQLMDLSKLESGKLKLEASEGDLGSFTAAVAGSFESLSVRQQVGFQIDVPQEPVICHFDRDKVEKILVNLISNSFKFTGEGGSVEVTVDVAGGKAKLTVKDTGIGIPAEQLPHLFERFTKSTASEVQAGSGIGLALVKELAELHGGGIEVESKEGQGTKFTVALAVGRAFFENEEMVAVTPPAPPQGGLESAGNQGGLESAGNQGGLEPAVSQVSGFEKLFSKFSSASTPLEGGRGVTAEILSPPNKPLVLLAEDNPDVRSYIAETLAGDYKIIEAENGKLALEKALETIPDLVISDIMMPEMDGMEFCKMLKTNEKTSHIPVVMLTALAEQGDKLKGLETGAEDYLVKPFDARELQVRVANLISQRQNLQEHYRRSLTAFTAAPVEAQSMDAVFLQKVKETVEANLDDEHFSVVELGKKISMSRSQLHRKLSALTGFSPNEIIRNMRLERAKQLLEKQAGTVSEIAYLCGFSSPAYFTKCFKEYFGTTPGEIA